MATAVFVLGIGGTLLAAEKVTLTIWVDENVFSVYKGYFEKMFFDDIEEFESQQPNLEIKLERIPGGSAEFRVKLAAALQSETEPAIFKTDEAPVVAMMEGGYLDTAPDWFVESYLSRGGYQSIIDLSSWQGKVMGSPMNISNLFAFYNKTIFEEVGLARAPQTWEELVLYGKKIARPGPDGEPTTIAFSVRYAGSPPGITDKFLPFLWQSGGEFVKEMNGEVEAAFNTPEGLKALQFYGDLVNKYKISSVKFPKPWKAFRMGVSGMIYRESWLVEQLQNDVPELDFGTAVLPIPEGGKQATITYMELWAVTNRLSALEKEFAWRFLDFLNIPSKELKRNKVTGWLPMFKQNALDPYFQSEYIKASVDMLAYGKSLPHGTVSLIEIETILGEGIQKVLYGEASVEDALSVAEEEMNKVLLGEE